MPLTSFSFIVSGSGSTPTITVNQAGSQAGDLAVIFNRSQSGNTNVTDGIWEGFTQLIQTGLGTFWLGTILAKILDGSETTVTGSDATGTGTLERWVCMIFRPDSPLASFAGNDFVGEITAGDPASQTISATGATPPVILVGHMGSSGAVDPRTTSPAMNEISSSTQYYAHYLIYNTGETPLNNTYDMADEGNGNTIQSGYLTFTELAGQPAAKRGGGVPYMRHNSGLWAPMFRGAIGATSRLAA